MKKIVELIFIRVGTLIAQLKYLSEYICVRLWLIKKKNDHENTPFNYAALIFNEIFYTTNWVNTIR